MIANLRGGSGVSCIFVHRYFNCKIGPDFNASESYNLDKILMEYKGDMNLSTYLRNYSSIMSLTTKLNFIFQIVMGLRFLRDRNIYHLDIKPDNVLIRLTYSPNEPTKKNMILKLIDFGESFLHGSMGFHNNRGMTIPYAAP